MSDFLIYAARLQDVGICSLWVSLGSNKDGTRVMHVSPDATTPRALAESYPTRTFDLCGTDRVLERVKDNMIYSDFGPTPERVLAAIAEHPLLADDLSEWFMDYKSLNVPTEAEIDAAAETITDAQVKSTQDYVRGLMKGIDVVRARRAMQVQS